MDLEKFLQQKKKIEFLQEEKARLMGAMEQVRSRLRSDLKVKDDKEAEEYLKQLKQELTKAEFHYAKVEERFEEKWKDKIERETSTPSIQIRSR